MSRVFLVGYTKMVLDGVEERPEHLISYCGRVSNPNNQRNFDTAPKLLSYLVKHGHWSPFEMAHVVLGIETTRDIGRQILRHRSFSFQEFSQRYAEVQDMELSEARLQDPNNRQNSIPLTDYGEAIETWWTNNQERAMNAALDVYNKALDLGIAKEVARKVLPEGMSKTRMYMAGSVRSWIHYIQTRTGNGTQKEHVEVARKCRAIILNLFPSLNEVLNGQDNESNQG